MKVQFEPIDSLESGDLVQLKSGGPMMTILEKTKDGVHCIWFNQAQGSFRQEVGVFPSSALKTELISNVVFRD